MCYFYKILFCLIIKVIVPEFYHLCSALHFGNTTVVRTIYVYYEKKKTIMNITTLIIKIIWQPVDSPHWSLMCTLYLIRIRKYNKNMLNK